MQPVEGVDNLCVHPLFVRELNDQRGLDRLRQAKTKVVYPYGTEIEGLSDGS